MVENEKKAKLLPFGVVRFFFGIGDFVFSLMSNVETFFWNDFLVNIAGFVPAIAAVIMTIASTVDACLSWVYGALLNAVKPRKWGRYRSWLILLPWIVPFLFAFQFLSLSSNMTLSAIIIVAATIISHFIWNIPWSANITMISVMGKTPVQRQQLASSRATWNNLTTIIWTWAGAPLAAVMASIIGNKSKYAALAFVLGALMAVAYWVHFKISKGREEIAEPNASAQVQSTAVKKQKVPFIDMLKVLGKTPSLIFLIIADLPRWMVRFVVSGAAIFYFRDVIGKPSLMATYILISGIAAFVGAYLSGALAKKVAVRPLYLFSCIFMAVLFIISYFVYSNAWAVIILISVAQLAYGSSFASAAPLYADTAVYAQWKTGQDHRGWIMGLGTVPLKVAIVVKGIAMNVALASIGYTAGKYDISAATEHTKRVIAMPFTLVPAVALVVGVLIFAFGYRLNKKKVLQYQAEIDKRETV